MTDSNSPMPPRPQLELPPPIVERHGDIYVIREDCCRVGDANGTKARAIYDIARAVRGRLITAGGRTSTQALMSVCVADYLGIGFEFHCPDGATTNILDFIQRRGGSLVRHAAGYTSVVNARAKAAARPEDFYVPTGVELPQMVRVSAAVAAQIDEWRPRLIVPVGSGMTLCGILTALRGNPNRPHVVGIVVGSMITVVRRMGKWAPPAWRNWTELIPTKSDYHQPALDCFGDVPVDPYYSGKCVPFLKPGDMFWNSGARQMVLGLK